MPRTANTRPLLVLLAAVPLCLGATACGSTSKDASTASTGAPRSTATATTASSTSDATRIQSEEDEVLDFGHPANPADRQAVTTLVKHYYAAAAAENGAAACSLVLPSVANTVPEDYGEGAGPRYLRGGKTCHEVLTRMFIHLHQRLASDDATMKVTHVRLKTRGGYAVLRFRSPPEREITVVHEGGTWKVSSLLDSKL